MVFSRCLPPSQASGRTNPLSELFARQKVSQKFGGEAPRPTMRGGDEDVPRRPPLHERRAQYDAVAAKRAAHAAELLGEWGPLTSGARVWGSVAAWRAANEAELLGENGPLTSGARVGGSPPAFCLV